jgi:hypothetical protein
MPSCKRCGGQVVQKNRLRLMVVGIAFLLSPALGWLWWPLWIPAVILVLTGCYLIAWAASGQGRWCRGCKRFDGV